MSNDLATIPQHGYSELQRMAEDVFKSGLFGVRKPEDAIALFLLAQAEGLHPMKAIQDYDIIQGRPAMKSAALLGRFNRYGGKVEWLETTDKVAMGVFTHPNGSSIKVTWTIEQAAAIKLTNKDNWRNYPGPMLRWRCCAEGIRAIAPEVLSGLYTVEEVRDFAEVAEVNQVDTARYETASTAVQRHESATQQGVDVDFSAPEGQFADFEVLWGLAKVSSRDEPYIAYKMLCKETGKVGWVSCWQVPAAIKALGDAPADYRGDLRCKVKQGKGGFWAIEQFNLPEYEEFEEIELGEPISMDVPWDMNDPGPVSPGD